MQDSLPKLALGTWLMGGNRQADPDNDDAKDIAVIKTALDCGIMLIDTAQYYGNGKCEELVGEAIKSYSRHAYQILTKQIASKLTYDEVIKGCHDSMQRMGIEYIDYFVCHAPNPDVDMHDFFKASNQLYKDGLIKHVGISNFGPKLLQLAIETSELPISLNQVSFSLQDDDIISTGTYDFCVKNNIPVQAYRTLVGLYSNTEILAALTNIGKTHKVSPQQTAIAFLNTYENMYFTIRSSSAEHWQEIKDALDLKLSDEEIAQLKKVQKGRKGMFHQHLVL